MTSEELLERALGAVVKELKRAPVGEIVVVSEVPHSREKEAEEFRAKGVEAALVGRISRASARAFLRKFAPALDADLYGKGTKAPVIVVARGERPRVAMVCPWMVN